MKKVFKNKDRMVCIFTDEGVSLYGDKKEAFYPYGCMKSISMSLLGELQIDFGLNEVSFVPEKADRAAVRQAIKEAKALCKNAEYQEAKIYSKCRKVSEDLPPEEQLKEYKTLFAACTISKGYYDLKKRLLKDA